MRWRERFRGFDHAVGLARYCLKGSAPLEAAKILEDFAQKLRDGASPPLPATEVDDALAAQRLEDQP